MAVLRTAIQEHLDSWREAVDPGFDRLKGLLIRDRVCGPSEHHQAMLNEKNGASEIRSIR